MTDVLPTPDRPVYTMLPQDETKGTIRYSIIVDEGWRSYILCSDMYRWAAAWLLETLGRAPCAPNRDDPPRLVWSGSAADLDTIRLRLARYREQPYVTVGADLPPLLVDQFATYLESLFRLIDQQRAELDARGGRDPS